MGVPECECLSGIRYGSVCVQAGARWCAHVCSSLLLRRSLPLTAHTAPSAWSSLKQRCDPPDPDISFIRTPTGKRSAAQHGATTEFHEPMKTNVSACKAEEGVRLGQCHCHAGPVPCRAPCPAPDHQMADPSPRPCVDSRGMALARQWHTERSVASSAVRALTAGFIGSCHSLAFSICFSGSAACDRTGDTREHQRCVQPFPCEYSEYPTVSTPSTPPQVRRRNHSRRRSRWEMTSAHRRIPQVRVLTVPLGSMCEYSQ